MDRAVLQAQLVALRACVGSLQAQVDALEVWCGAADAEPVTPSLPTCDHEERVFIGTLGEPRWECRRCGQEFGEAGGGSAGIQ